MKDGEAVAGTAVAEGATVTMSVAVAEGATVTVSVAVATAAASVIGQGDAPFDRSPLAIAARDPLRIGPVPVSRAASVSVIPVLCDSVLA